MADNNKAGEATSVKQLFQGMLPTGAEVVQGTVTSASPLKIQITNNEKLILGENILIIPKHLTNYTATIDISLGKGSVLSSTSSKNKQGKHGHPADGISDAEGEHVHSLSSFRLKGVSMTVYNALKVGEKVHVLAFNNDKKYYVLDRVV
ncbi:MAG: DUF2577 domain-containing protein [Oscillospiraceae bacterium]